MWVWEASRYPAQSDLQLVQFYLHSKNS